MQPGLLWEVLDLGNPPPSLNQSLSIHSHLKTNSALLYRGSLIFEVSLTLKADKSTHRAVNVISLIQ